jgi:putative FmdB family regulatory protein
MLTLASKMPRYVYRCTKCEGEFQVRHGMKETQESCELCESKGVLQRIPQLTSISKPPSEEGKRINEAIEENKEIFNQLNKEARTQEL